MLGAWPACIPQSDPCQLNVFAVRSARGLFIKTKSETPHALALLQAFLKDPEKRQASFRWEKKRRRHAE